MRLAWVALIALFTACASVTRGPASHQVVVISLDGLRPEFYRDPGFEAPELKALAAEGASAAAAETIYPSVTYPSHTTLVTGVSSARHGIHSNTVFDPEKGPSRQWYWNASSIRSPTLWQRAKESGKKVALLSWPVSVGADAEWVVPEIFSVEGVHLTTSWELTRENTRPELMREILQNTEVRDPESIRNYRVHDLFMTDAAIHLLKEHHPDLLMIHLLGVDEAQHETGRDSPETRQALKDADALIRRIAGAIDLEHATLIVTGDHGFIDYRETINVNALFLKKGWIRLDSKGQLRDWKVIAHSSGGTAAIHVRDPKLAPRVLALLRKSAGTAYQVLDRARLDELEAFPDALCAVEANEGYGIRQGVTGIDAPFLEKSPRVLGQHGYLPSLAKLKTGFIAVGAGVSRNLELGEIRTLDVAPTVARLLGAEMPGIEGKPIALMGNSRR